MAPTRHLGLWLLVLVSASASASACGGASSASCGDAACDDSGGSSGTATAADATDGPASTSTSPSEPATSGSDGSDGPGQTTGEATTGDEATDGGSDDAPGVCPSGTHVCLDAPPEGWAGPVVLRRADAEESPTACGGLYPEDLGAFQLDPTTQEQSCSCSCGAASDVNCPSTITHSSAAQCNANPTTINLPTNNCVNIVDTPNDYWVVESQPSGGSCQATANHHVPDVEYASSVRVCGGAVLPDGCAATEVCTPVPAAPVAATWCIFREGEHECPSEGSYLEGGSHFTSDDDTRGCTGCNCGVPQGTCQDPSAVLYVDDVCTAITAYGGSATGMCTAATTVSAPTIRAVRRTTGGTFSGSCTPAGGTPFGAFTPGDPITICCTR